MTSIPCPILIEFEECVKNILILCGFDPYSALYSLIPDFNLEVVSLKKKFDMSSCVFNDYTDSSRQHDHNIFS